MRKVTNRKEIILVSDYFYPDYVGGAELTLAALLDDAPVKVRRIRSDKLNAWHLIQHRRKFWIFANLEQVNLDLLPKIARTIRYATIEFDYRYCLHRSPDKCEAANKEPCRCKIEQYEELLYAAEFVYFMSQAQRDLFCARVDETIKDRSAVLSSVFAKDTLNFIKVLVSEKEHDDRNKWLILFNESWVKGLKNTVAEAKSKGLDYEILGTLPYTDLLRQFKKARGLVYCPNGNDTCPRTTIEARLLGCELVLNDHVQHKDEAWFNAPRDEILDYLYSRSKVFWKSVTETAEKEVSNV